MQKHRLNGKRLSLFQGALSRLFKRIRNRLKTVERRKYEKGGETEDIHSVEIFQLENLILKKIHFHLFKTEEGLPLSEVRSPVVKEALQKAKPAFGEKAVFAALRGRGKEEPVVLVCATGALSKKLAEKLRKKGRFNSYFLKGGAAGSAGSAGDSDSDSDKKANENSLKP